MRLKNIDMKEVMLDNTCTCFTFVEKMLFLLLCLNTQIDPQSVKI